MSEPVEPTGLNEVQAVKLDLRDAGDGKVAVTRAQRALLEDGRVPLVALLGSIRLLFPPA